MLAVTWCGGDMLTYVDGREGKWVVNTQAEERVKPNEVVWG